MSDPGSDSEASHASTASEDLPVLERYARRGRAKKTKADTLLASNRPRWKVGDEVEGYWEEDEEWLDCTVSAVYDDGTYLLDDGEDDWNVEAAEVRVRAVGQDRVESAVERLHGNAAEAAARREERGRKHFDAVHSFRPTLHTAGAGSSDHAVDVHARSSRPVHERLYERGENRRQRNLADKAKEVAANPNWDYTDKPSYVTRALRSLLLLLVPLLLLLLYRTAPLLLLLLLLPLLLLLLPTAQRRFCYYYCYCTAQRHFC